MDVEDWDRTCMDGFMQWEDCGIIDPDRRSGPNPVEPADLGMEENGSESVCPEAETPSGTSSATASTPSGTVTSANSPNSQLPPSNHSFTDSSEWSSSPCLSLTGEPMLMPHPWYWPNPALQPAPSLAHHHPPLWECPKCNRSFKKKSGLTTHAKHCEGMGSSCNQKFVRRQKRGWAAAAAEGGGTSGPAKAATKTVQDVRQAPLQAAKAPYLGQATSAPPPDLWAVPPESFGGHALAMPPPPPPPPSMMGMGWPGMEVPSLFFLVDPSIPQHVPQSLEEMTDITMAHLNYIASVFGAPPPCPPVPPVPSDFPPPPAALFPI